MKKILVIDDDKGFVRACEIILKTEGHQVVSAHTVAGARECLLKERFDFVFLDVYLDKEDGILFLQEIRDSELIQNQKTIILSGIRSNVDALACESLNATDYIQKEGDFGLLRQNLLDALEKKPKNETGS